MWAGPLPLMMTDFQPQYALAADNWPPAFSAASCTGPSAQGLRLHELAVQVSAMQMRHGSVLDSSHNMQIATKQAKYDVFDLSSHRYAEQADADS